MVAWVNIRKTDICDGFLDLQFVRGCVSKMSIKAWNQLQLASHFDAPARWNSRSSNNCMLLYAHIWTASAVSIFDPISHSCQLKWHTRVTTRHVSQPTCPIVWNHIWTIVLLRSHIDRPLRCHMYANVSAIAPKRIAAIKQGPFGQILLLCPVRPPSLELLCQFI